MGALLAYISEYRNCELTRTVHTRAARRRRRAAAAAADHMSASRRRSFRGVLTSCRTPAFLLLDFCNAVYNEA